MSKNLVVTVVAAVMIFFIGGCGGGGGSAAVTSNNKQLPQSQPASSPNATPSIYDISYLFFSKEAELTKLPAKTQLTDQPYIKGEAVLFKQETPREKKAKGEKARWGFDLELSNKKIPAAKKPEDVGTVILNSCNEIPIGSYEGYDLGTKIPAYGQKCDVTIIDKTIPAVIYRKTFQSQLEKNEIVTRDTKEIKKLPPSTEIYNFLESLPKK